MQIKEINKIYKQKKKQLKSEYKRDKRKIKAEYIRKREELKNQRILDINAAYESCGKRPPIDPPRRHLLEEIGNSVTHGVGALFAIFAFFFMLIYSETAEEYLGASVYFFGLFVMFLMSCLYHAFPHGSRVKRLFRRFDYSCIYLLIGATFAPILLCYVGGGFGIAFFIIQWVIIITGITLIGVFGPTRLRKMHIPLYIVLGWCGAMFAPLMIERDPAMCAYILGGGVVYSLGIIPFAIDKKASHFIWHFFVLAGAVLQWVGVFIYIYLK